ncbi:MAG TPA: hypothetical protein PKL10_15905, partial [Nitrospira sp.]|nr:hypothetical protein [Nitrospira sp.]
CHHKSCAADYAGVLDRVRQHLRNTVIHMEIPTVNETTKSGFTYTVETVRRKTGVVVERETIHNIMPAQGRNHALDVLLNGATPVTAWYLVPYGNDYAPQDTDTAATFIGLAGELTNYTGSTRIAINTAAASGGVVSNSANRAEFEFDAETTIRGLALISTPSKGAASGILLSAVRLASPKTPDPDFLLRVLAVIDLQSA